MSNNICQFYIIVGDKNFVCPNDYNVYINATDVTDMKIIQDEIFRVYKEKAQLGIRVASEIVFLVGSISDSEKANQLIKALRLNGKIEVIPKEVVKEEKKEEKANDVIEESLNKKNIEILEKEEIKEENKLPDNVYKRDFDSTSYSGYIGKPIEKSDRFSKLPLIIFIISLLLFIGSIILLFVF